MYTMQFNKIKVIHCDFNQNSIDEVLKKPLRLFYYDLDIRATVSQAVDNPAEYGVLMTHKYRVFSNKDNSSLIGSYISEQWFFIKFPNSDDVALMNDLRWLCINAINYSRDKFEAIRQEKKYPFREWDFVEVHFQEVDNILSLLRQAASQS